jgi:hypothetical protein
MTAIRTDVAMPENVHEHTTPLYSTDIVDLSAFREQKQEQVGQLVRTLISGIEALITDRSAAMQALVGKPFDAVSAMAAADAYFGKHVKPPYDFS